jgi:hypothetical protein
MRQRWTKARIGVPGVARRLRPHNCNQGATVPRRSRAGVTPAPC